MQLLHITQTPTFKLGSNLICIMDSANKVRNIIIRGCDPEENWLEVVFTDIKEHLAQTFLKLGVLWLLIDHRFDYCFIITINRYSFPFPMGTPQFG